MKAINDDNTSAPWRGNEPGAVIPGGLEARSAFPYRMVCNNAFK